jgi:hypothetical protein
MVEHRIISRRRIWLARGIAALADLIQLTLFPIFFQGSALPFHAVLDVVVAIVLILLVGWHIAFVPTFIIELLPFADLAPTWTLATFIATRGRAGSKPTDDPKLLPPQ